MAAESINDLLFEAGTLLVVGMCVVFAFLGLLIVGINLIAWFCRKFPGQEPQTPLRASKPKSPSTDHGLSDHVVAAISAAVHSHHKKNQ
ncbi:oxaloacetate decarboxylase [Alteromonas aestuariivivens]|uniref:Probable oxaloacetate decarboxylase gamma chain n=1 Tax=Alteromonas aestuariivivens TaxID=1938339 RepID=A0A3D8M6A7_9ALTE|nr:OadG family transporter subunit [Alteromonas aestuariivivens]RDV25110.1 oxaloacetate decarboxylase [Alteromonas aestuariivivens]